MALDGASVKQMKVFLEEPCSQAAYTPAHSLSSPQPPPPKTLHFTQVASFPSHQNFLMLIFLSLFYWHDAILLSTP